MKKHRILSFIMACVFACSLCGGAAGAEAPRSSPTLSRYSATITQGSGSGKLVITYSVTANSKADSLGISSMKIYKSNGSYVTTIYPTSSNGLKKTGAMIHKSSYTYTGVSGTSYYAEITFFATIDGVTDSQPYTTNTETAP